MKDENEILYRHYAEKMRNLIATNEIDAFMFPPYLLRNFLEETLYFNCFVSIRQARAKVKFIKIVALASISFRGFIRIYSIP